MVFTYERSRDPKNSIHHRVVANIKNAVAVDDHTVKFMLGAPQASFLGKTLERTAGRAMAIVSRGALASMGEAEYGLKAVGTGPFRVTAHTMGQDMVLERFENYYDPERPKLDKVIITPIPENEPLAAAIEAGDIQFISGNEVEPALVDRFKANPDIVVEAVPAPGFEGIFINPWRDPFKVSDFDKPLSELLKEKGFMVRMAIAKAIDRDRYIERAQFGRGLPAYGTINPAMAYYFDETLGESSAQKFDLEEARRLLAAAGYPNGKGFPKLKIVVTAQVGLGLSSVAETSDQGFGIFHERGNDVPALFFGGRDEAADGREVVRPLFGSEAAGDFLLELRHAHVLLGLIVGEGHGEVGEEA